MQELRDKNNSTLVDILIFLIGITTLWRK